MSAATQSLSVIKLLALALPAAAIFYQVMLQVAEDSRRSGFHVHGIYTSMILTIAFFIIGLITAVSVYRSATSYPLLGTAVTLTAAGIASMSIAVIVGYWASSDRYKQYIEEKIQEPITEINHELEALEEELNQIEESADLDANPRKELAASNEFDIGESAVEDFETVGEYIEAQRDRIEETRSELRDQDQAVDDLQEQKDIFSMMKISKSDIIEFVRHPIRSFRRKEVIRYWILMITTFTTILSYGEVPIIVTGGLAAVSILLLIRG